jgi:hypothetical protein
MRTPLASKVNTILVPAAGQDPALLYQAADIPLRILVRNIGGNAVSLAHDVSSLQQQPPSQSGTFQLPPGASEVFVLQARESLVAAAAGAGGAVSIAVSEAIPQVWMES